MRVIDTDGLSHVVPLCGCPSSTPHLTRVQVDEEPYSTSGPGLRLTWLCEACSTLTVLSFVDHSGGTWITEGTEDGEDYLDDEDPEAPPRRPLVVSVRGQRVLEEDA